MIVSVRPCGPGGRDVDSAETGRGARRRRDVRRRVAGPALFLGRRARRLYCLDRVTGAVLWERTAYTGLPKVKAASAAARWVLCGVAMTRASTFGSFTRICQSWVARANP